jgi:hypothetical protein
MLHAQLLDNLLIRAALAAAVLLGCFAAMPGSAHADAAQVTVVTPGGSQQTLALEALAGSEDVLERAYVLRSSTGESSQTVTGLSVGAILDAAGADPFGFSYLEVQRPAGGSVLLSRHQALDPGAFAEGFPVVYATAAGTGFLRPSTGVDDLNAGDAFEAPQGVTLVLRKGSSLLVKIEASTLTTSPGKPVAFEAVVDRAGSGEQLSYSWYFDDGHSATGAGARHSFAKRGSYDVVVGVTTPGDQAGASAVVTIQVGAPLSGPDRKGGGRNREANAPDHGAATGTPGAVPPGPVSRVGHTPPDTRPSAALSVRRGTTDAPLRRAERESAAGEPVVGELVSADTPIGAGKLVGARHGQLENDGEGSGLPGAALGLLITAGLLGGGALIEVRR